MRRKQVRRGGEYTGAPSQASSPLLAKKVPKEKKKRKQKQNLLLIKRGCPQSRQKAGDCWGVVCWCCSRNAPCSLYYTIFFSNSTEAASTEERRKLKKEKSVCLFLFLFFFCFCVGE